MSTPRVHIQHRKTIYRGRVFQLIREALTMDGVAMVRETIVHPGAVVIVPLLDRSHIVFVRQYRHAVKKDLLELPAGTLKRGEPLVHCARRELAEETGWAPGRLQRIGRFYAAPGYTNEQLTVFLARDLTPAEARSDEDEFVTPVTLTFRTAMAKIDAGHICDAKSIIGIILAQRFLA